MSAASHAAASLACFVMFVRLNPQWLDDDEVVARVFVAYLRDAGLVGPRRDAGLSTAISEVLAGTRRTTAVPA